jgi:hypothetical protein
MNIPISIKLKSTNQPLVVNIMLDGTSIWHHSVPQEEHTVTADLNDTEGLGHVLEIKLEGKTPAQTSLDQFGNIVQDSLVEITAISIDDIDFMPTFLTQSSYQHDFNGAGPDNQENFYGQMGCNGTVSWKFVSPVYVWLLSHE